MPDTRMQMPGQDTGDSAAPIPAPHRPAHPVEGSAYRAPFWLPGAHLQTIVPATLAPRPEVAYRRERWETPDHFTPGHPPNHTASGKNDASTTQHDFIELDWVDGHATHPAHAAHAGQPGIAVAQPPPLLALFHGLEGSSNSHYARATMAQVQTLGWQGVVPHFRGCGSALNLAPRFYHSGDSAEIDWILRRLHDQLQAQRPGAALYALGVSLGGNALLKWLGEQGTKARGIVTAAAAVSAPMDLTAGGAALSRGFNMVYTRTFLRSLKAKCLAKLEQYPDLFDRTAMLASRDLYEFDNVVTAPLHGFRDTDDYWRRASSKPLLGGIAVPTLVLNARNDPFLPASALPASGQASPSVILDFPAQGGHVGFMQCGLDWLPRRTLHFFRHGH